MIYERGTPQDYDSWFNITGDSLWSYKNVEPEFRDFESQRNSKHTSSKKGKVPIALPDYAPLAEEFIASGKEWVRKFKGVHSFASENGTKVLKFNYYS